MDKKQTTRENLEERTFFPFEGGIIELKLPQREIPQDYSLPTSSIYAVAGK